MKKYMLMIAFGFLFTSFSNAFHKADVFIKAHKVIFEKGISDEKIHKMMKCMLCLKKHDTVEAAIAEKEAKINEKCAKHNIGDRKCKLIKMKALKAIHHCYDKAEFLKEFFFKGAKPEEHKVPTETTMPTTPTTGPVTTPDTTVHTETTQPTVQNP